MTRLPEATAYGANIEKPRFLARGRKGQRLYSRPSANEDPTEYTAKMKGFTEAYLIPEDAELEKRVQEFIEGKRYEPSKGTGRRRKNRRTTVAGAGSDRSDIA